jgi:hypothetical protein
MPLKKIPLPPGFDKNDTASQAEGRWIDGDNVRFQYGSPEKIGGWSQISNSILVGAARDIHSWFDLTGRRYVAIGTDKVLYILFDEEYYDITPLGTALTSCTFNTTNGSTTVTVNKVGHNLDAGDLFTFTSVTPPTGFTATDFTTNTFEVKTITSNYIILITDRILHVTTGSVTLTLPTASGNVGREFIIDNAATTTITVICTGVETIESELSQSIPPDSAMNIFAVSSVGYRIY